MVLEENVLRQRVTTDIATRAGQFDVLTIGNYEVPIWAKQNWLEPMDGLPADYDANDLLKTVREGVSRDGKLYALPFYGESAMTYYRKDLFDKAGLTMPEAPTYDEIKGFAAKLTDKANQTYGLCLRGKPGWGENMAYVTTLVDTFGGQWFGEGWKTTFDTPEWKNALTYYTDVLKIYGPPGATSNGFNENLALFASGRCAMWIDSTVAAGLLYDPKQSQVADKVAFAPMPTGSFKGGPTWLWSWNLGIPASSSRRTRQDLRRLGDEQAYVEMVAKENGWVAVPPPGTRQSTYTSPDYQKAAPFAGFVLKAIDSANPNGQTKNPRPYNRRAVRGDPRVPGHRQPGRPDGRGDADRSADDRRGRSRPPSRPPSGRCARRAIRSRTGPRPVTLDLDRNGASPSPVWERGQG